ncbi:MerR family transcriptional regulator [Promicromonospora sp. NPDC060271]|uniref:MerR family transcriptional regulator n=1 Tax=Promicromonospora sp. NPDC060271 TaxID=3347089 RepID=UPI003655B5F3
MLTISDFSEMCYLSPQTLRYYHSEGLLVPADVDPQTGYRSYTFDQVEQAMLITALRGTGMSVKLVRRALDEPGEAPALLREHAAEVAAQRQLQDEAISDARELLGARPEVRLRHVPEATVVSRLVAVELAGRDRYDWTAAETTLGAAVTDLVATVESCGAVVSGTPWRGWTRGTQEQRQGPDGPPWLVSVPVEADAKALAALPDGVEAHTFEAREEVSIFLPGKSSMAKFATAMSRLTTHPLDGAYVDFSRMRQVLHDDGVETALAVRRLEDDDLAG